MTEHTIDKIIGTNLSRMRHTKGFTQAEFGAALQRPVSPQQISKYERGEDRIASSSLVEFAKTLNCNVTDLFDGVDQVIPSNADMSTRGDLSMMQNYKTLSPSMQESIRVLCAAMVMEVAQKRRIS